jgi:predicted RNA-binding protein YlxR (DUF448 family)
MESSMLVQAQDLDHDGGVTDGDEPDRGPRHAAAATARMCAVTRVVRPVEELIRFVAGPDGLVPDLKRRLPGRGVWVTARRSDIAAAVKRGAFQKSLRADVKIPSGLPEMVDGLLERAALDALAIAHKAALVVTGFTRVETAIAERPVAALFHAKDGSADGARKLEAALARRDAAAGPIEIVRTFTTEQLDLALGRLNVVHAALLAGRAGETFLARWRILECFRAVEPDERQSGSWRPNRDRAEPGS